VDDPTHGDPQDAAGEGSAKPLPLAGIRVLEFCHVIMGPSAASCSPTGREVSRSNGGGRPHAAVAASPPLLRHLHPQQALARHRPEGARGAAVFDACWPAPMW